MTNQRTLKKRNGNVADIIGSMFCLMMLLIVVCVGINAMKIMQVKMGVDRVVRTGSLLLEEQGTLSTADITTLLDTLANDGFTTVEVTVNGSLVYTGSGTAVEAPRATYGQECSIGIVATAYASDLHLFNAGSVWNNEWTFNSNAVTVSKARQL